LGYALPASQTGIETEISFKHGFLAVFGRMIQLI